MKKIKKRNMLIFVAFIMLTITGLLLAVNIFQNSSQNTEINAQLNNIGYLEYGNFGYTKLFLISAKTSYGVYDGQACFIITATIRNDYTTEQPPPMDNFQIDSSGRAYFGLTATLYDGASELSSNNITPGSRPHLGVPQISLYSGETDTVEIYMTINNRNIDNYSINLVILTGYPIP